MGFNKRQLWKRKIRWYNIPMKVLNLSSFEKQKENVWQFSETRTKRQTDIKKIITSANERDKAHFKRVKDTSITDLLNLAIKAVQFTPILYIHWTKLNH